MPIVRNLQDAQAAALRGPDKLMTEPVKISFLTKQGGVDPNRQAIEVVGVLRVGGGKETNASGGSAQDWRSRVAAGKAELHLNASTYKGHAIRAGDRVRAVSRVHQPWFECLRVDDRGETRLVLELGEI